MFKWSNLQGIAQSKAAGLTVLIPLIGFFIFFNDFSSKYIKLNEVFLQDLGVSNANSEPIAQKVSEGATMIRLYFLYFGLSFVEVGTFIFRIFCPEQIKKCRGADNFYEIESKLPPCDRLREAVYVSALNRIAADGSFYIMTATRKRFRERYVVLFERMKQDTTIANELGTDGFRQPRRFADTWSKYILNSSQSHQYQSQMVADFAYELLKSEYLIYDRSKSFIRMLIGFLVYLGLILLAIPTFQAFLKISAKVYANYDKILPFILQF